MRIQLLILLLALFAVSGVSAQDSLIAPNIFVRGMRLAQGVRYTAAFVKPSDDAILHNVSVEMTLPRDAVFLEMLVSRQVEFDVIRRSPQKQLTLIWQISRINAEQALDSFSFTLDQPLSEAVEFYMQWEDESGAQHVENFFERPLIIDASQTDTTATLMQGGMQPLGATGIQIAPPPNALPLTLTARVLPNDFNPPPEYGDLWWCSLLALEGLPAGSSAQVIVPLRRPVAPFTALAMFQQQADGTWTPMASQAIVTADGQYAVYMHPGGVVATGGKEEIQQEPLTVEQVTIVEAPKEPDPAPVVAESVPVVVAPVEPPPPPIEPTAIPIEPTQAPVEPSAIPIEPTQVPIVPTSVPPTIAPVTDGSSNTVIVTENPPTSAPAATKKTDGVTIVGATPIQPTPIATLGRAPTLAGITDGSSNTIVIGEPSRTPTQPAPTATGKGGSVIVGGITSASPTPALLPTLGSAPTQATFADGTSNTILVGEARTPSILPTPAPFPTLGGSAQPIATFADGTSNTLLIGEGTRTLAPTPTLLPTLGNAQPLATFADGTSNTILVGETRTPAILPTPTLFPTLGGNAPAVATFADGTSNTILVGEGTRTLAPTALPDSVAPTSTAKTDGVITVGGVTATPGLIVTGKGGAVIVGGITSASPTPGLLPTLGGPAPTLPGITDGSSNTILVGEGTRTLAPTALPDSVPPTLAPFATLGGAPTLAGITDGSSNTILFGEATKTATPPPLVTRAQPTATATFVPTVAPTTVQLSPGVIVNPPPVVNPILPFGGGGTRVEILAVSNKQMTQCSAGNVNCAVIVRIVGKGKR